MPASPRPRRPFAWLLAGLLGLVAYAWTASRLDPLVGARLGSHSEATARALGAEVLGRYGVALPPGARLRVQQRRSPRLADVLYARLGRTGFRADAARWPVFLWEFTAAAGEDSPASPAQGYAADFDGQGRLAALRLPGEFETGARPDSAALRAVAAPEAAEAPRAPDSTVQAHRARAVALARHHLRTTVFAGLPLRVDSVRAGVPETQRVFLRATGGAPLFVEATVHRRGALVGLEWSTVPEAGRNAAAGAQRRLYGMLTLVALLGLVFSAVVRFLVQLRRREVDLRASFRDGVALGAVMALFWGLSSYASIATSLPSLSQRLLVVALNALLLGVMGMLVGMAASGSAEATLRPVLPGKLLSLELLRRGAWADRRLGRSLLRGMASAAVVLGGVSLAAWALPLYYGTRSASALVLGAMVAPGVAMAAWCMVFGVVLVLVLVVPLLRHGVPRTPARRAALVAAGAAMGLLMRGLEGFALDVDLLMLVALGVAAAVLTARFDPLAGIAAFTYGTYAWFMREPWLTGAAVPPDVWLGTLLVPLVLAGAALLARYGTRQQAADAYVPDYVADREERARMAHELAIAHEIQQRFLPQAMPRVPGLDAAAVCLPAYEVGGDLYDFLHLGPGRLGVVVGDVSGKGTQAAFVMTLVKGALQTLASDDLAPADVLRRLNRTVRANVPRGVFVSLVYAVLDVPARRLTLARAGHNPVVVRSAAGGPPRLVQPPGLALGLADGTAFDRAVADETLALAPGDLVALYTDGFSEAMDADRALYTDERLAEGLAARPADTAQAALDATLADVRAFVGTARQHDDMTLVLLRLDG